MSTANSHFNALLDNTEVDDFRIDRLNGETAGESKQTSWAESGYEGHIDYRVRQLSFSSNTLLHTCPRKYQLYKLKSQGTAKGDKDKITLNFGGIVGEAIQASLEDKPEYRVIWEMFLGWNLDIFAEDPKLKKSLFHAIWALKKFNALRAAGLLADYELVYYEGKPACELSFAILLPDGFRFRGFVDAVLRHKLSGEILVLECKTTGLKALNPTMFKNSSQAIGYSIVLDHLFPDLSSYKVLYLVYQTHSEEFTPVPFNKTLLQRAQWIRELLLEVETIKLYEEAQLYPMHGESCYVFYRECEYINTCTLSTAYLTKPCTPEGEDKFDYQIVITLADLLDTQIKKVNET